MAKEVIMPKFGFTQETAEIVKWLKQEGDKVEMGDLIAEVTTDKVNMEVEAMDEGILAGLKYKEGDVVPVAQVIAYIIKPGEKVPKSTEAPVPLQPQAASAPSAPVPSQTVPAGGAGGNATPVAARVAQDLNVDLSRVTGSGSGGRITREDVEAFARGQVSSNGKVRATPSARRIANENSVVLNQVQGTGPNGRIQGPDVIQFAQRGPSMQPGVMPLAGYEAEIIPMTSMRRTIASRLQQSYQQSPHIYFDAEVDITELEKLRAFAGKVSMTAFITRIAAWALTKHPYINSQIDGNNILLMKNINIGIAVALDNGLIVPVLRNANEKSVLKIATEIGEIAEKAKSNQLKPEDLADGTFTISNLGMFGVDRFTAIINPPQTAILAVSRAAKKFVPDANDQPTVRSMMNITLSVDHRVIDGAVAAKFLSDLRDGLEGPGRIIL